MSRRMLVLFAAVALLACGRGETKARHPEPVSRALQANPHRLAVVFWPQLSGCSSCDQMISAVIAEWKAAPDAEVAVVTVMPDTVTRQDPWLPGTIVRLPLNDYKQHAGGAPLPRVELWSGRGELLMSRSVPNYGSQAALLHEEMLAARSFTAPVAVAAGEGAR